MHVGMGCKYFSTARQPSLFHLLWIALLHCFTFSCLHLKISSFWHSRHTYKVCVGEKYFSQICWIQTLTCSLAEIQYKLFLWQQCILDEYHKELNLNKPSDDLCHHHSPLKWNCFSSKTKKINTNPSFLSKYYRYPKKVSRVNSLTLLNLEAE